MAKLPDNQVPKNWVVWLAGNFSMSEFNTHFLNLGTLVWSTKYGESHHLQSFQKTTLY